MKQIYAMRTRKTILLIIYVLAVFSWGTASANPCATVTSIQCGTDYTFSSFGFGDVGYPNGMGLTGCFSTAGQGGQEAVYSFLVPVTGTYQLNVVNTSANGQNRYSYMWKYAIDGCNTTGWTCIGQTTADNVPLAGIQWSAGEEVLLLVNAETTASSSCTFRIRCATPVCDQIPVIGCDSNIVFSTFGYGDVNYPSGMGQAACFSAAGQGGLEQIYSFTPPIDGTYQFNVVNTSDNGQNRYSYMWKYASDGCDTTDWNCINDTNDDNVPLAGIPWAAGEEVLILVNAQTVSSSSCTFRIRCATPVCDQVPVIGCDSNIVFSTFGYGDVNYPSGMGQAACYSAAGQGGLEQIYSFTPPIDGTYQFNVVNTSGNGQNHYSYMWKFASDGCDTTDWNCVNDTDDDNVPLAGIPWAAGEEVLILVNAQTVESSSCTFRIRCATTVCDQIPVIGCDSNIVFSSFGYGDVNYPSGMGQAACFSAAGQGGLEQIYSFTPPIDGTYQFNVVNTSDNGQNRYSYMWKYASDGCDTTDWNCINDTNDDNVPLAGIPWAAGEEVLILVNAQTVGSSSCTFRIRCATPVCDQIPVIGCDSNIVFSTFGYGDVNYPSGMGQPACFTNAGQGGLEQIYSFTPPIDGTYQFNVVNTSGNGQNRYSYMWKYASDGCDTTDWNCIDDTANDNVPLAGIFWDNGQELLILVNAQTVESSSCTFTLVCPLGVGVNETIDQQATALPNPTTGPVTLTRNNAADAGMLQLYDAVGQLVVERTVRAGEGRITLDLSGQPSGIYVASLRSNDGAREMVRIVKQ